MSRIHAGRALAAALSLAGCAALFGCAPTVVGSPVPSTAVSGVAAPDDDLIADLNEHHRHHHQGGVTMFVALSLDTLGLPPEQQAAVAKLQADLFARMESARAGEQGVLTALADGMVAGAIDEARIHAALAQLESASGLVHAATVDTLNQLHAALTPEQRAALVEKIWAHWSVFGQANAEEDPDNRRLGQLAAEIGLSPAQVDTLGKRLHGATSAAAGAETAEIDAHLRRLGTFRESGFDARTLEGGAAADAHLAARGAARMVRFYETVAPVLTPEQRAKVALLLREHATHNDAAVGPAH